MDIFKKFLDDVSSTEQYTYERVDKLAEIYSPGDAIPIATVEYDKPHGTMNIHFRIALSSTVIAKLTHAMTLAESCLHFEEDFFVDDEYGYLYGDDARQAFIDRLKSNIEASQIEENANGAFFLSEEPLNIFGDDNRTKFQKMWDEE